MKPTPEGERRQSRGRRTPNECAETREAESPTPCSGRREEADPPQRTSEPGNEPENERKKARERGKRETAEKTPAHAELRDATRSCGHAATNPPPLDGETARKRPNESNSRVET
ncbi:histone lysine methyltransferase SET2 [Besnoitia besnoiti]|uniref:Histone lysine methyltransferase SET2 n=1 Tax=Besnoitia besnoiti TaxID=94643 RepID=A0A2A9M8V8_BESBE|nr:histone lysine methyltransferase SET2 [Besnoitia besnoiti]PFH32057.1 histone lysine methyltransferase SET2 [Besnoitia besnoiti]